MEQDRSCPVTDLDNPSIDNSKCTNVAEPSSTNCESLHSDSSEEFNPDIPNVLVTCHATKDEAENPIFIAPQIDSGDAREIVSVSGDESSDSDC